MTWNYQPPYEATSEQWPYYFKSCTIYFLLCLDGAEEKTDPNTFFFSKRRKRPPTSANPINCVEQMHALNVSVVEHHPFCTEMIVETWLHTCFLREALRLHTGLLVTRWNNSMQTKFQIEYTTYRSISKTSSKMWNENFELASQLSRKGRGARCGWPCIGQCRMVPVQAPWLRSMIKT